MKRQSQSSQEEEIPSEEEMSLTMEDPPSYEEKLLLDEGVELPKSGEGLKGEEHLRTVIQTKALGGATPKAPALKSLHRDMKTKTKNLTESMKSLDDDRKLWFDQLADDCNKVFQDYKDTTASEYQVQFLHDVIKKQHEAFNTLMDSFQSINVIQEEKIQELTEEFALLVNKEDFLKQKMEILAKENVLKRGSKDNGCYVCSSPKHKAENCFQFADAAARKAQLELDGKCTLCYETTHIEADCPKEAILNICQKCSNGKHERFLCPIFATKEKTHRRFKNDNGIQDEKPQPKEQEQEPMTSEEGAKKEKKASSVPKH